VKKIILVILLCNFGCAGLNHDMIANALNNADEQLVKDCKCKKEKKKSSKLDPRFSPDLYDDEDSFNEN
jgi:hypothetical protein